MVEPTSMSATVVGTTTRRSLHHFYRHDRERTPRLDRGPPACRPAAPVAQRREEEKRTSPRQPTPCSRAGWSLTSAPVQDWRARSIRLSIERWGADLSVDEPAGMWKGARMRRNRANYFPRKSRCYRPNGELLDCGATRNHAHGERSAPSCRRYTVRSSSRRRSPRQLARASQKWPDL
jgi:hypothetical protein